MLDYFFCPPCGVETFTPISLNFYLIDCKSSCVIVKVERKKEGIYALSSILVSVCQGLSCGYEGGHEENVIDVLSVHTILKLHFHWNNILTMFF